MLRLLFVNARLKGQFKVGQNLIPDSPSIMDFLERKKKKNAGSILFKLKRKNFNAIIIHVWLSFTAWKVQKIFMLKTTLVYIFIHVLQQRRSDNPTDLNLGGLLTTCPPPPTHVLIKALRDIYIEMCMKRNFLTTHSEKCHVKGISAVCKCVCVRSRKVTCKNVKGILLYVNVSAYIQGKSFRKTLC